jgi:HEAT repeats
LQNAVRTGTMFSFDHPSSVRPLQQSFNLLVPLLKTRQQFTIGFVEQRVMINNVLTSDANLKQLENEFLKRGVGAITFYVGITFDRYKRVLTVLTTAASEIEESGGTTAFLLRNVLESARIHAAPKNERRDKSGDTVLDVDSEAYLRSKANAGTAIHLPDLAGLELLFESAGAPKPPDWAGGGPTDILRIVNETVQRAVVEEHGNPKQSYVALARMLQEVRPDFFLPAFPKERHRDLKEASSERVAAEFIENAAFQWASKRVTDLPKGSKGSLIEDEVVSVLVRSLHATEMADQLAQKLASYFQEYALPKTTYEKLQEELRWIALPRIEKHARLMNLKTFAPSEVRRLISHVQDLIKIADPEGACVVANHFFEFLEDPAAPMTPESLSRAPELIAELAGLRAFTEVTAGRLARAVADPRHSEFIHFQVVNAITALATRAALCEHFDIVNTIAEVLQDSVEYDAWSHSRCCAAAMKRLMPSSAVERLIEMVVERRGEATLLATAARLIRVGGRPVAEQFMTKLELATDAGQRLTLLRLLGRSGDGVLQVARDRLKSPTWYVARNACVLLSELRDPQLLEQIQGALAYPHERVQSAAVDAVLRSKDPRRLPLLAESLSVLPRQLREKALWELRVARDSSTVQPIGDFIFRHNYGDSRAARAAVEVLAAIKTDAALDLLAVILADDNFETSLRHFVLDALKSDGSVHSQTLLKEFVAMSPSDPLAQQSGVAAESSF